MLTKNNTATDEHGDAVLEFQSAAHNLTRVAELNAKLVAMAASGHWRHYRNALGDNTWRRAEFDYFLIACELSWDDVSRVIAWNKAGSTIGELMNHDAPRSQRRSLADASAAWHARGPETLEQMAARLGWANDGRLRLAPISSRARAKIGQHSLEDQAQARRAAELGEERCRELELIAAQAITVTERRYLASILRAHSKRVTRHGTDAMYISGCRCELCTAAHREYRQKTRHAKPG